MAVYNIGMGPSGKIVMVSGGQVGFVRTLESDWTPAQIATDGWYDAADASTITEAGGFVSQWDDKSGNAHHSTQGNGALQPTTGVRTINSLNVIDFNGSTTSMLNMSFVLSNTHTIFAVGSSDGTGYRRLLTSDTNNYYYLGIAAPSGYFATFYGDGSWHDVANNVANLSVADPTVMGVVSDGTNATPYHNGTSQTAKTSDMGGSAPAGLHFGREPSGSQFWDGPIAEIVIINTNISDTDRQRMEGYLAWKWGLEADLPVSHPYKNEPPII